MTKREPPRLFIVAGMPRTATTFLFQRFQEHPAIFCPYRKETNFFSVNYHRGIDWYQGLYAGMSPGQIGADVSPSYFLEQGSLARILKDAPDARVILGIRQPSDWAFSWYAQVATHHWRNKPDLEEFLTGYPYRFGGGKIWQDLRNGYVSKTIDRYCQAFGGSLLLYRYEAIRTDPLTVLNGIEDFLGIPRHFDPSNLRTDFVNAGTRRNLGLFTQLVSKEIFVDTVGRLLPRKLVQAGRNLYVRLGTSADAPRTRSFTEHETALVQEVFAGDDNAIEERFSGRSVLLGTDCPAFA